MEPYTIIKIYMYYIDPLGLFFLQQLADTICIL